MERDRCVRIPLAAFLLSAAAAAVDLKPFEVQWIPSGKVEADASLLLAKPAGASGFVSVQGGKLVDGAGKRFRIWGVNLSFTGSFPRKEDAPAYASHLARYGINCVRIHHHDWRSPRGLIDAKHPDSRHLDAEMLDRFDFFVSELKKQGIYVDLNLNVARAFQPGDGVKDAGQLGFGKAVTLFDPRIIELQKEFARAYLTHRNPYTGLEYRQEPAVALVEILNENSLVEYWKAGRLTGRGPDPQAADKTWSDIPASYAAGLDRLYQRYLRGKLTTEQLRELEKEVGASEIPRLRPPEFARASPLRFQTEAWFYIGLESAFYEDFQRFLKNDLGVRQPVIGTSVHNGGLTPYALTVSLAKLDVVDGHTYWQHPRYFHEGGVRKFEIRNTPMVDDPENSTVMTLSRVAVAGKPYTVSEVNHPYPNEYGAEMIPILSAYAAFHDWDGIFWYSFSHTSPDAWKPAPPSFFDIRNDPVKMAQLVSGAMLFLRGDVAPARHTVLRNYTRAQIAESLRLGGAERPFFTPGMPRRLALRHATRTGAFDAAQTSAWPEVPAGDAVSDTGELAWSKGLVEVKTPRTIVLAGRVPSGAGREVKVKLENAFIALMLSSLDGEPLAKSARLLLTAAGKTANAGMKWNEKRTTLLENGTAPVLIEPARGAISLASLAGARNVRLRPLDGGGVAMGPPVQARRDGAAWVLPLSSDTVWYVVEVTR